MKIIIILLLILGHLPVYAQDGALDSSFNNIGTELFAIGDRCSAYSTALTSTGHLIVSGFSSVFGGHARFTTANFFPNGKIDSSFGVNGVAIDSFPASLQDQIKMVLVQPNGRIVALGISDTGLPSSRTTISMIRYLPNGLKDSTFGIFGKALFTFGNLCSAQSMILQPSGKILIAGVASGKFLVARIKANGAVDSTFGANGFVLTSIGTLPYDHAYAITLQPDGKILAAGSSYHTTNYYASIVRYFPNGRIDSSFGTAGVATTIVHGTYDVINSLNVQYDGKIIAAGTSLVSSSGSTVDNEFMVIRYDSTGHLDNTYGTAGILQINPGNYDDKILSSILLPDGKIMIGGYSLNAFSNPDFAICRIDTNGSLDFSFGTGGMVTTNFTFGSINCLDFGNCLNLQDDGKILLTGYSTNTGRNFFAIARYLNDFYLSTPDFSFNPNLLVYPNPIGNTLNLSLDLQTGIANRIDLMDITGHLVSCLMESKQFVAGNNNVLLNIPDTIPKGEYLLVIQSGDGKKLCVKVIR